MKLLTIGFLSAANLKPTGKVLFNEEPTPETKPTKTFTQEDIDKAYKAGVQKAKKNLIDEELKKELEELRNFKKQQEEQLQTKNLLNNINSLELKSLRGHNRFVNEFKDRLTGKEGKELKAEIEKIKAEEGNDLYFVEEQTTNPKPSASLLEAATQTPQPKKVEYFEGTTIRKP